MARKGTQKILPQGSKQTNSNPKAALDAPEKGEVSKISNNIIQDVKYNVISDIYKNLSTLSEGLSKKDTILIARASKFNSNIRKGVSYGILKSLLAKFAKDNFKPIADDLCSTMSDLLIDESEEMIELPTETFQIHEELTAYLLLLSVVFLTDQEEHGVAVKYTKRVLETLTAVNRRTLDQITAKLYFYYGLLCEKTGAKSRDWMFIAHRSACLRHDDASNAVLSNVILRSLLADGLFIQADKFRLASKFPEAHSNYQTARYYYYVGRINIVQLNYTDAYDDLSKAIRKAPQGTALGFRQHAYKLLVLVQLLMGEIPERGLYSRADLQRALHPYLEITKAVRVGDLTHFTHVQNEYKQVFEDDCTIKLINRLRRNVIKTGLRKISVSYSRISLSDVKERLGLPSDSDAEYAVSKSIHDGVMDAVIDRSGKYVYSKENADVYKSNEPQLAFDRRIKFCLDIHNESVKAMRFPEKSQVEGEEVEEEINLEALVMELEEDDEEM